MRMCLRTIAAGSPLGSFSGREGAPAGAPDAAAESSFYPQAARKRSPVAAQASIFMLIGQRGIRRLGAAEEPCPLLFII